MTKGSFVYTSQSRRGAASTVTILLQAGILIALIVVAYLLIRPSKQWPPQQKPLNDPQRAQEVLKAGRTYRAILKAGLDARVEDKDWGVTELTTLAYAAEFVINRKIESNDGAKIVELRNFEACRCTKILTKADVRIDIGPPGQIVLGVIDTYVAPGTVAVINAVKPLAENILSEASKQAMEQHTTVAKAMVDSLSGKSARITYVDGSEAGVTSIEPVGCTLSDSERDFLYSTAVLSDAHIMQLNMKPGDKWIIDGGQFSGFFDPTMRGMPVGDIEVAREPDVREKDVPFAVLRITRGILELDTSDQSMSRIGRFVPTGELRYNLADNCVSTAALTGEMSIEQLSKDHLLFESRMRTEPRLSLNYSCTLQP